MNHTCTQLNCQDPYCMYKSNAVTKLFTRQLDPKTVHELRYGKTKKI